MWRSKGRSRVRIPASPPYGIEEEKGDSNYGEHITAKVVMKNKAVYIIAGPNGSGKTTFATLFLPDYVNCQNFVNADLIAKGLAPFEPRAAAIKAGKLVLQQIHDYAERGIHFAFETTLSGKSYVSLSSELKSKGYALHLFFFGFPVRN